MKNVKFYPEYFEVNGMRYSYNTPRGDRLYLDMIAEVKAIKIVRPLIEEALKSAVEMGRKQYVKGLEMSLAVLQARQYDTERDIDTFYVNSGRVNRTY